MALHPVGPLPAATYWRRRLVLLIVLVAVVLLVRSCVAGDPPAERASTPTPTPSPTSSTRPSPVQATTCPDGAITLSVRTDAPSYAAGTSPKITLTVTNTSRVSCTRDLGGAQVEALVYSGLDRIWSSDDCGSDRGREVLRLGPGQSLETTVTWSGKRSARGCPTDRPEAKPGTYTARGRVGTKASTTAVFRVHS